MTPEAAQLLLWLGGGLILTPLLVVLFLLLTNGGVNLWLDREQAQNKADRRFHRKARRDSKILVLLEPGHPEYRS